MPTRQRVEAFIEAVVHGDHAQAIRDFYHADATMQENLEPPRGGRDALVAHEQAALARLSRMHTHAPDTFLVDGDKVTIVWTFDATDKKGVTRRLNEVTLQHWTGDRIARERFIYDTATAWAVVGGDGG